MMPGRRSPGRSNGVEVIADTATVTNFGIIGGTAFGVMLGGGGTVVDTGTISGSTAIHFGGTGDNLLVLTPGYKIAGSISALGTGNTLELLGSATSAVTANFTSLDPAGFQTVAFAPGAGGYATLKITNDSALPGTIAGFIGVGETIDLTALSDARRRRQHQLQHCDQCADRHRRQWLGRFATQPELAVYGANPWLALNDGSGHTAVVAGTGAAAAGERAAGDQRHAGRIRAFPTGATDTPFSTVVITDNNLSATDSVTATLSDTSDGALSNSVAGHLRPNHRRLFRQRHAGAQVTDRPRGVWCSPPRRYRAPTSSPPGSP